LHPFECRDRFGAGAAAYRREVLTVVSTGVVFGQPVLGVPFRLPFPHSTHVIVMGPVLAHEKVPCLVILARDNGDASFKKKRSVTARPR
jgi:hypothetical protein